MNTCTQKNIIKDKIGCILFYKILVLGLILCFIEDSLRKTPPIYQTELLQLDCRKNRYGGH